MRDRFKIERRFRRHTAAVLMLGTLAMSSGYVIAEDLPGKGVTVSPLYLGQAEEWMPSSVMLRPGKRPTSISGMTGWIGQAKLAAK